MEKTEKLEKGYTDEQLKAFLLQAFREKRCIRRTADGHWEKFPPPLHEPPQTVESAHPASQKSPETPRSRWQRLLQKIKTFKINVR